MGGKASFTPSFNAWRFYADGTESGSSPYGGAAQDTNVTVNVGGGNQQIHLRVLIQETGGAAGASTDDWALEFAINGSPTYNAITASSSRVQADTGSSLTDGSATTNRGTNGITDGSGTFVAGEQEEGNGTIEDHALSASNFTEHVYALLIVAADNANGDTLDFRIALNGGNPGMTNNVTPRITISSPTVATGDGSSDGTGAATAVGASTADSDGSASGTGAASAVGASTFEGVGSAAGTGAASGDGVRVNTADGSASGTGAASGVGQSTADADGASSGTGAATAVGASTAAADGASSGTGAASGGGAATFDGVGAAAGAGAASGDGLGVNVTDGAASGVGAASGTGASSFAGDGTASGTGAASGVGASSSDAVGAASGVGAAEAVGTTIGDATGVGAAAGVGAAFGVGASTTDGVGAASGVGTASAVGQGDTTETPAPPQTGTGGGGSIKAGSGRYVKIGEPVEHVRLVARPVVLRIATTSAVVNQAEPAPEPPVAVSGSAIAFRIVTGTASVGFDDTAEVIDLVRQLRRLQRSEKRKLLEQKVKTAQSELSSFLKETG